MLVHPNNLEIFCCRCNLYGSDAGRSERPCSYSYVSETTGGKILIAQVQNRYFGFLALFSYIIGAVCCAAGDVLKYTYLASEYFYLSLGLFQASSSLTSPEFT